MRLGLAGPVCGLLYTMNLKFEPRIDLFHSPHSAATGCDDDRQRDASHQKASLLIKLVHPILKLVVLFPRLRWLKLARGSTFMSQLQKTQQCRSRNSMVLQHSTTTKSPELEGNSQNVKLTCQSKELKVGSEADKVLSPAPQWLVASTGSRSGGWCILTEYAHKGPN